MALLIRSKVQAAALLEVLVAITLIVIVFTGGTLIYLQVTSSSFTGEKLRAGKALDAVMMQTRKEKSFFDEELKVGELRVEKEVINYENNEQVIWVNLKAFNSHEKLLAQKRELLLLEDELQLLKKSE